MRAEAPPGEVQIANSLVLVMSAGVSLRDWDLSGSLEREAALYRMLSPRFGRLVIVSEGDARDAPLAPRLVASRAAVDLICNDRAQSRAAFIASLPERVHERLRGPAPADRPPTAVVKTNQFDAGDAALHLTAGLRSRGVRVGLVARGGYPWSRFVAREAGPDSPRAAEAAAAEAELCRAADVVVGSTRAMLDDLAWRYGLAETRLALVPNYVCDEARPDPCSAREPGTILLAGRLVAQKRIDLLIDAAALLRERRRLPDSPPPRLTIVGEGELESALREHARARAVDAEFLPRLPHAELLARMRRCAVYAQTSAYEGHPKTVLEAMACAAPVAVTDAPGLGNVVEHGTTGLVCRAEPEAVARALARLLGDTDLAAALGREAAAGAAPLRLERVAPLEAAAHARAIARAGEGATPPAGAVRWGPELLQAQPEAAAEAWARSMHGYSRRLPPDRRARFAALVETPLYHVIDRAAIETSGGVHPKHRLMKYHDFFVERIRRGERVLDLGCGYAQVARSIAERCGAHVTGIDCSESNVAQAHAMIEREGLADCLAVLRADLTRDRATAPDGSSRFDVVVLSNVLEHLRDREALLARLVEWYSPRAILIRVPAFDRNWQAAWKRDLGVDYRCDDTHETEYTEADLRAELAAAGLAVSDFTARWGEYWLSAEPQTPPAPASAAEPLAAARHAYTDRHTKAASIARVYAPVLAGSVLDVGCGEGLLRRHLPRPDLYTGVDFRPTADVAADLERGSLPFADASFDTVVCTDVLEHLEAAHAMFDECCRVARSHLVISLPNPVRNFVTELFAGSGGRMKYYGLPPENPGDRHRWFFGFDEAAAFVRSRAARNGFTVEQLDSSHDGCCYWLNGSGENVLDHPNIHRGNLWAVLRRDRAR